YVTLARPITVLMPMVGFLSGAVTAWGAGGDKPPITAGLLLPVVTGMLMAGIFNAGSNALNQIYDLAIDRVNKPKRPLPSGSLTVAQVWVFTAITYALALVLAWFVAPLGRHECFWLVAIAVICTVIYSVPPLRPKRLGV